MVRNPLLIALSKVLDFGVPSIVWWNMARSDWVVFFLMTPFACGLIAGQSSFPAVLPMFVVGVPYGMSTVHSCVLGS